MADLGVADRYAACMAKYLVADPPDFAGPTIEEYFMLSGTSFSMWLVLFFVSRAVSPMLSQTYSSLDGPTKGEWDSRVVSNAHAILNTLGAFYVLNTESLKGHILRPSMNATVFICLLIGYLAYDFLLVIRYINTMSSVGSTIFHHVLGLVVFSASVLHQEALYFAMTFIFTEISTPFVNQRWFLAMAGDKGSKQLIAVGLTMVFLFITVRCGYAAMGGLFWMIQNQNGILYEVSPICKFLIPLAWLGASSVNFYWTSLMIRGLVKKLNSMKKKE